MLFKSKFNSKLTHSKPNIFQKSSFKNIHSFAEAYFSGALFFNSVFFILLISLLTFSIVYSPLSFADTPSTPTVQTNEVIGKTVMTVNKVHASRHDSTRVLKRSSDLYLEDLVSTGENARGQFRFADGTLLTLGENTHFSLDQYYYAQQGEQGAKAEPKVSFNLITGTFRAITGKVTKVKSPNFTVKTPLGSIGIRGTDFWGGYLTEDKIDVFLVSGEHSVIVENAYGKVSLNHAGEGTTIAPGKAPSKPKKWPKAKVDRAVATVALP